MSRPLVHCRILAPLLWLVLALGAVSSARAATLTAEPLTQDLYLRRYAPIPLEIAVTNATPRLLEGRLEATLLLGDLRIGVHRSMELVVQPGRQLVSLLLPPVPDAESGDSISVALRFAGKDGVLDLGIHRLGSCRGEEDYILAVEYRTGRRQSDLEVKRERSLRIESLRPERDLAGWNRFTTHDTPLEIELLPLHPHGWCAYDAVMLDEAAFAATNEKQLTGLARWIEAGGSALLCTGATLAPRHLAFLQRLTEFEQPPMALRLDEQDRLEANGAPAGLHLLRTGLGRVVIAGQRPANEKALASNAWCAAVAWLWKMREDQQAHVAKHGSWAGERPDRGFVGEAGSVDLHVWLNATAIGYDVLTPGRPRALPLGIVAALLGTLLLLAGPGDWFFLGWLRRRRWTWIVFPLLCALCGWGATLLAGRYLGRSGHGGFVRIVDIGPGNRVLREARVEMLMPPDDREWTVEAREGFVLPQPRHSNENMFGVGLQPPAPNQFRPQAATGETASEWRTPTHFLLRRNLRQWTPATMQTTTFPAASSDTGPDWLAMAARFRAEPKSAVTSTQAFESGPFRVLFGELRSVTRQYTVASPTPSGSLEVNYQTRNVALTGYISGVTRLPYDVAKALLSGTGELESARLLSQRSPTVIGLPAVLAANPAPLIALAWRETEHEMHIYRRHFAPGELAP